MKITKRQLRRIIKESLMLENLKKLLKKHVRYGVGTTPNKMADTIIADPEFLEDMSKEQVAHAVMDYQDKMMGF